MSLDELENKILMISTPNGKNNFIDKHIGDLITDNTGILSINDGNSYINVNTSDNSYNTYNWQDDFITINQIYFQERVKELYVFCIYKQDNIFKIGLFEIGVDYNQVSKTDKLNEIIDILKKDLSIEEFREYERRIFQYF